MVFVFVSTVIVIGSTVIINEGTHAVRNLTPVPNFFLSSQSIQKQTYAVSWDLDQIYITDDEQSRI